ncbi:hypothetical protein D039_1937B, partial [Vibrio parahaemolyticus EKP-028]
PRTSSHLGYE